MADRIKVAVIGGGSVGRRHIGNLLALGCDVYVSEPSEVARARVTSEHPTSRVHGLLGGDEAFDALVVATPHDSHLFWVEDAIRRQCAVFVEKPLGSLEQIEDWRRVVGASHRLVTQVGYMLRFHPNLKALRAIWQPLRRVVCVVQCDMRTWPGGNYGPPLIELSHEIDIALWGGVQRLRSVDRNTQSGELNLCFDEQSSVSLNGSSDKYWRYWSGYSQKNYSADWGVDSPEELGADMYRAEIEHFLSCVRDNRQTDCPLSDGLRVLEVCAEVEAMARQAA